MYKLGILDGDDIGLEVVPECVKVDEGGGVEGGLDIEWVPMPSRAARMTKSAIRIPPGTHGNAGFARRLGSGADRSP